jgi:phytoene dehydrogenase-like protein
VLGWFAAYLARAGVDVLVLEQADRPGGGARTDETLPGYRFDTHSVAHNIINMTPIPRELRLADAGLEYREMDPFAVAVFADGRRVRFHRSVERTIASIAEVDRDEADAYGEFMTVALPLLDLISVGLQAAGSPRVVLQLLARRLPTSLRALRREPLRLVAELMAPYGRVLDSRLRSDLTRAPVAAFAAHAGTGPMTPAGALFVFWQAAYHRFGQWHAVGGAGALTAALVRRLNSLGGRLRCHAPVARIDCTGGRARAVVLEDGEVLTAAAVITAMDPKTALLELCDPPLSRRPGDDLRATHRSNAVQALVHVATDRLPPYLDARPGDWTVCRATWTAWTGCATRSLRPRTADCTARRPRMPSRPPRSTTPWRHRGTTRSTWRARPRRSTSMTAGSPPARAWPKTSSTRSSNARPASATA